MMHRASAMPVGLQGPRTAPHGLGAQAALPPHVPRVHGRILSLTPNRIGGARRGAAIASLGDESGSRQPDNPDLTAPIPVPGPEAAQPGKEGMPQNLMRPSPESPETATPDRMPDYDKQMEEKKKGGEDEIEGEDRQPPNPSPSSAQTNSTDTPASAMGRPVIMTSTDTRRSLRDAGLGSLPGAGIYAATLITTGSLLFASLSVNGAGLSGGHNGALWALGHPIPPSTLAVMLPFLPGPGADVHTAPPVSHFEVQVPTTMTTDTPTTDSVAMAENKIPGDGSAYEVASWKGPTDSRGWPIGPDARSEGGLTLPAERSGLGSVADPGLKKLADKTGGSDTRQVLKKAKTNIQGAVSMASDDTTAPAYEVASWKGPKDERGYPTGPTTGSGTSSVGTGATEGLRKFGSKVKSTEPREVLDKAKKGIKEAVSMATDDTTTPAYEVASWKGPKDERGYPTGAGSKSSSSKGTISLPGASASEAGRAGNTNPASSRLPGAIGDQSAQDLANKIEAGATSATNKIKGAFSQLVDDNTTSTPAMTSGWVAAGGPTDTTDNIQYGFEEVSWKGPTDSRGWPIGPDARSEGGLTLPAERSGLGSVADPGLKKLADKTGGSDTRQVLNKAKSNIKGAVSMAATPEAAYEVAAWKGQKAEGGNPTAPSRSFKEFTGLPRASASEAGRSGNTNPASSSLPRSTEENSAQDLVNKVGASVAKKVKGAVSQVPDNITDDITLSSPAMASGWVAAGGPTDTTGNIQYGFEEVSWKGPTDSRGWPIGPDARSEGGLTLPAERSGLGSVADPGLKKLADKTGGSDTRQVLNKAKTNIKGAVSMAATPEAAYEVASWKGPKDSRGYPTGPTSGSGIAGGATEGLRKFGSKVKSTEPREVLDKAKKGIKEAVSMASDGVTAPAYEVASWKGPKESRGWPIGPDARSEGGLTLPAERSGLGSVADPGLKKLADKSGGSDTRDVLDKAKRNIKGAVSMADGIAIPAYEVASWKGPTDSRGWPIGPDARSEGGLRLPAERSGLGSVADPGLKKLADKTGGSDTRQVLNKAKSNIKGAVSMAATPEAAYEVASWKGPKDSRGYPTGPTSGSGIASGATEGLRKLGDKVKSTDTREVVIKTKTRVKEAVSMASPAPAFEVAWFWDKPAGPPAGTAATAPGAGSGATARPAPGSQDLPLQTSSEKGKAGVTNPASPELPGAVGDPSAKELVNKLDNTSQPVTPLPPRSLLPRPDPYPNNPKAPPQLLEPFKPKEGSGNNPADRLIPTDRDSMNAPQQCCDGEGVSRSPTGATGAPKKECAPGPCP